RCPARRVGRGTPIAGRVADATTRSGGATIRSIEEEAAMKRQSMMTMNSILAKWSGRRSATPLQRIAADPRTWILASALATAGGRALGRWLTRFDLRNRTVLITGGTRGLGLELARQAGLAGARVAICGRDSDTLARARESLSGTRAAVLALACDVSDRHQV